MGRGETDLVQCLGHSNAVSPIHARKVMAICRLGQAPCAAFAMLEPQPSGRGRRWYGRAGVPPGAAYFTSAWSR